MSGPLSLARAGARRVVRRGPREVIWTPAYMGFGNLLYLALWCDEDPVNRRFLRTARLEPWLATFPTLSELAVTPEQVQRRDIRRSAVVHSYGRFGDDFTKEQLDQFVRRRLLRAFPAAVTDTVVVNIRRGDYYDDQAVRGYFGMDLNGYLRVAVPRLLEHGPATALHVVSDGLDWCRARMGWIEQELGVPLTFASEADGALANFVDVATARRILMTNSTFSYWAGYVHDVLYPNTEADVWAPRFFNRWQPDHSAWQLNPRWSVIEDIPGGWDS